MNSKLGSLRILTEHYGEQMVEEMVIYFITDLNDFFNVARPMTGTQIAMTATIAIESYPYWTPEDFSRCFYKIKAMKYGPIYEGLDGGKILGFMQQYEEEFTAEKELLNKKEIESKREDFNNQMQATGEFLLPVLKSVVEKLDQPKTVKPNQVRERTENEKRFDRWIKQFDDHYFKRPVCPGGSKTVKFIKKYGKVMDLNKFLEYKLEQYENHGKLNG